MAEVQNRLDQLNECIRKHVEDVSIWSNSCELRKFSTGCGVFATRDIEPNELLFGDKAMMLGPAGNKHDPIVCAMCFDRIEGQVSSYLCSGRCGLVLCGKSTCAKHHEKECELLQKWKPKNPNEFSLNKAKALLVIRSVFLNNDKRKFFDLMQKNFDKFEKEIFFNTEFENFPQDKETIYCLRAAAAAINTNGFKVLYQCGENGAADVSVRSFYPIMSLLNHQCLPNSRHDINDKFVSRVIASRHIRKDEQVFISYSQLLWGTNTRRVHMMVSKQFSCTCDRCADPTEMSTNLSAIRCQNKPCTGFLLPIEPINFKSNAKCTTCDQVFESRRFLQMHELCATMIKHFLNKQFTMDELNHFIEQRLYKVVPDCSQFVLECKLKAIWKFTGTNYDGIFILVYSIKYFTLKLDTTVFEN